MGLARLSASMLLASFILLLSWTMTSAESHDFTSSGLSLQHRVKRDLPFEAREKTKETLQAFKDLVTIVIQAKEVLEPLSKLASLAPGAIGLLFSVVNMALAFVPQFDPVLHEVQVGFDEVNMKLDSLSIQIFKLTTDRDWLHYASVYSQDELRIINAWRKFSEFHRNNASVQSPEEKLQLAERFTNYYEYTGTEASVANFYHYLTVSSTSLSENLNTLLRKKFKCGIREIGKYNFYFSTLLLRGLMLNEVYWKLIGMNTSNKEAEHARMFRNVYKAQFASLKYCMTNYTQYVKDDVVEISKPMSHDNKTAVAHRVKKALDDKYIWCDWVVLVYSKSKQEKYDLYDMTKITVGEIIVAVSSTLKARVIHRKEIEEAAKECFGNCNITGKFKGCQFDISSPSEGYDGPTTFNFSEFAKVTFVTKDRDFVLVPAAFTQPSCGWFSPSVFVHYSRNMSVCRDLKCHNDGKCVPLPNSNDALCECEVGYYGDRCEKQVDPSVARKINLEYPLPTFTSMSGRLKTMESKLEEISNKISERCRA